MNAGQPIDASEPKRELKSVITRVEDLRDRTQNLRTRLHDMRCRLLGLDEPKGDKEPHAVPVPSGEFALLRDRMGQIESALEGADRYLGDLEAI